MMPLIIRAAIVAALAGWAGFYVGLEEGHKMGAAWQMKSLQYSACYLSGFQDAGGIRALRLIQSKVTEDSDPLEIARATDAGRALWNADEKCREELGIDDSFWERRIKEKNRK